MTRAYLDSTNSQFVSATNSVTITGTSGTQSVLIKDAVLDTVIPNTVEEIDFIGAISDYQFRQQTNSTTLEVLDQTGNLLASISATQQTLSFSDGTLQLSTSFNNGTLAITLGGEIISQSASNILPTLIDSSDTTTGISTTGNNAAQIYFEEGDTQYNVANSNTNINGTSGNQTVIFEEGVLGTTLSSNIESIALNQNLSHYQFRQIDNSSEVEITDQQGNVLATVPATGQSLNFSDTTTTVNAGFSNGQLTVSLGNATLNNTLTTFTSEELDTPSNTFLDGIDKNFHAIGDKITLSIDQSGEQDWIAVNLEAGHQYSFAMQDLGFSFQDGQFTNSSMDSHLTLYSTQGDLLAMDDNSGFQSDALLYYTAAETGRYYIEAEGVNDDTGTYKFTAHEGSASYITKLILSMLDMESSDLVNEPLQFNNTAGLNFRLDGREYTLSLTDSVVDAAKHWTDYAEALQSEIDSQISAGGAELQGLIVSVDYDYDEYVSLNNGTAITIPSVTITDTLGRTLEYSNSKTVWRSEPDFNHLSYGAVGERSDYEVLQLQNTTASALSASSSLNNSSLEQAIAVNDNLIGICEGELAW